MPDRTRRAGAGELTCLAAAGAARPVWHATHRAAAPRQLSRRAAQLGGAAVPVRVLLLRGRLAHAHDRLLRRSTRTGTAAPPTCAARRASCRGAAARWVACQTGRAAPAPADARAPPHAASR